MLPSLMVFGMVFLMIWLDATTNLSSIVNVATALAVGTGVFSAFRKKILLPEEDGS